MSKKSILYDIIMFVSAITFLIISRITNTYFGIDNIAVNLLITSFAIITVIFIMIVTRKEYGNNVKSAFVPFALTIIIYLIYHLPIFDFIAHKGVHNGLILLFTFSLYSRFLFSISKILKLREKQKSLLSKTPNYNYALNVILTNIGYFIIAAGILGSIFNAIYPVMDISIPFQLIIQGKSFKEVVNQI